MSAKHRLVDVGRPHANLVVPRTQVQLGEEAGIVEVVEQLVDDGYQMGVLHRECVQGMVVDVEPPCRVWLLDKEHGGGECRVAVADDALLDHRHALPLQFVFMRRWVPVQAHCHRRGVGLEDDVVIPGARRWKPPWFSEDVVEGAQQPVVQRVGRRGGVEARRKRWSYVVPADRAPVLLERHGLRHEIPDDRTLRSHPVSTQNHVISGQGHHEEADEELLAVDENRGLVDHAGARNALAVRHGRRHIGARARWAARCAAQPPPR